jgi:site-specific recombinase XerD
MNTSIYLEKYERDLNQIRFSKETIKNYSSNVKVFLDYFKQKDSPKHISSDEIKDYLIKVANNSNYQNAVHSSIKKFYEITIQQHNKFNFIPYAKKERKLPKVIDIDILKSKIDKIENSKHKAILSLTASVGLRVSEVINLKILDINSVSMEISINQGKGKKDRKVPLTENLLFVLRNYVKEYKPKEYLFNGQFGLQYSDRSCNQIVKKYIGKEYHMHTLRHSTATSLYEKGVELKMIGDLLGHKSRKTTEIYCHTSSKTLQKLPLSI